MNFAQIGYRLIKIYLVFFTVQIFCAALRYVQSPILRLISQTRTYNETRRSHHSFSPSFRPDDFRYLLASMCPFRSSETPPACSWEPRNNYYEEKESHLRLQPLLLTVSSLRIQLRSATTVRISEKRGRCATPLLSFFVSPLTGATSPLLSLGCQIHSQENRYL